MMNSSSNSRRGVTLIELLLYVSLSSVMLVVVVLLMTTLLKARVKNQTILEVESQGLATMQLILQTVRNAEAITSPSTGSSASSLTLDVLSASSDPTLFDLSTGVIRITEGAGAATALTNSRVVASSLTFQNLSRTATPGMVRVSFTLSYATTTGRNEYSYSRTFYGGASLRQP